MTAKTCGLFFVDHLMKPYGLVALVIRCRLACQLGSQKGGGAAGHQSTRSSDPSRLAACRFAASHLSRELDSVNATYRSCQPVVGI